jgi:hypothetical protein
MTFCQEGSKNLKYVDLRFNLHQNFVKISEIRVLIKIIKTK